MRKFLLVLLLIPVFSWSQVAFMRPRMNVDTLSVTYIIISGDTVTSVAYTDSTHLAAALALKAPLASPTFTGVTTVPVLKLSLHAVALGDSVFGKCFVDAADTTLKFWNGTAWKTITDLR